MTSSSQTQYSEWQPNTKQPGCIPDPNSTLPLSATSGMSSLPEPCEEPNAGISVEVYKTRSDEGLQAFHSVLISMWEEEKMLDDLHDATIVALNKHKGSRTDCGNYRGISS